MGGPMSYQRFRSRNGLMFRTEDADPYAWGTLPESQRSVFDPSGKPSGNMHCLVGDLNRMERDYTGATAGNTGDWLIKEVSEATGVGVEDARKVLRYVFFEQR